MRRRVMRSVGVLACAGALLARTAAALAAQDPEPHGSRPPGVPVALSALGTAAPIGLGVLALSGTRVAQEGQGGIALTGPAYRRRSSLSAAADTAQVVVISEKSALAAGVLEWAIPTVGYAYAGNWSRGIPPALVRIAGWVLWFEQLTNLRNPPPCEDRCVVGVVLSLGGTVWAVVDAGATAKRENERRRAAALGAAVVPTAGERGLGLNVRIPVGW